MFRWDPSQISSEWSLNGEITGYCLKNTSGGQPMMKHGEQDNTWVVETALLEAKWKSIGILERILLRIRSDARKASMEDSNNGNMETAIPSDTLSGFPSN